MSGKPNTSLVLNPTELAFVKRRFGGSKSAAIHAAMEAMMYPQTLYESPDTWGSYTVYADRDGMETTIASLIEAGGPEWAATTRLDDCRKMDLARTTGNGRAVYEVRHQRHPEWVLFELQSDALGGAEFRPIEWTGDENEMAEW